MLPERYRFIEDLWLSYFFKYEFGGNLVRSNNDFLLETDQFDQGREGSPLRPLKDELLNFCKDKWTRNTNHKLNKMFNVKVGWLTFYQHLVSQNIGKPTPHTDVRWDFSGVIYLKGSDGTWIDNEIVPFKYNRAVCFDAHIPHHPLHSTTDRLVLTFFSKYV